MDRYIVDFLLLLLIIEGVYVVYCKFFVGELIKVVDIGSGVGFFGIVLVIVWLGELFIFMDM